MYTNIVLICMIKAGECFNLGQIVKSVVLFPPPFYFVFDISNLLLYIQNIKL